MMHLNVQYQNSAKLTWEATTIAAATSGTTNSTIWRMEHSTLNNAK